MKSTYYIEHSKIREAMKGILEPVPEEKRVELLNTLEKELVGYSNADPWVLGRKVFLVLRDYGLEEKTSQFSITLINGDSFDEHIILCSVEYHKKKFPKQELLEKEI